jgi:glycosyltransferase involved in cell wall biosynthesis
MPTILHIIDTTGPGGAENVFINLADALRDRNYQSVVVIRGDGWVKQSLLARGIEPIVLPCEGSFNVTFVRQLCALIREHKVDLIQSHLLGSNVYSAIVGLVTRKPVVATYHGMVDIAPTERFRRLKLAVMRWGISRFVAVSDRLAADIEQRGLLQRNKLDIIYNGIELERYGKRAEQPLRQRLGLADGDLLFGCLGNIRPAKNYPLLLEAFAKVRAQLAAEQSTAVLHMAIAGQGQSGLSEMLEVQCASLGLTAVVHFLGYCEDGAEFLGQLDAFVLSSSSEGFSIATIEALATGLPVVATKCGGPEEIITDGENGLMGASEIAFALSE